MRYATCFGRKQGQRNEPETNLCEGDHQLAEVARCVGNDVLLQIGLVHLENNTSGLTLPAYAASHPTHPLPTKPLKSRNLWQRGYTPKKEGGVSRRNFTLIKSELVLLKLLSVTGDTQRRIRQGILKLTFDQGPPV